MSGFLFDNMAPGATEDARKGRRARRAVTTPREAGKPPERLLEAPRGKWSAEVVGKCDEGFECGDTVCGGTSGDIVAEDGGYWLVACCFCGTAVWVEANRSLEADGREFVFRGGQYDGQTLPQVAATPGGGRYLAWAAEKHPRQFVREAVKKWLTEQGSTR